MGCDIHMHIEMQAAGGVWTRVEDVVPNPYYIASEPQSAWNQPVHYEDWYNGRNYEDFAKLAGVRGVDRPIIEPRGLPDDVGWSTKQDWERWEGGAHTPHYYTLAEILPCQSQFRHSDGYKSEIETIIDRMREVAREELDGNHDKIRMVFWFDS